MFSIYLPYQKPPRWNIDPNALAYNCARLGLPNYGKRGLILTMPIWERAGNKVYDHSGDRRNGDLIATASWISAPCGPGVKFDGNSDYIQVSKGHELVKFSHEVIFIPNDITSRNICGIAESPGSATEDRALYIHDDSTFCFYIYDGANKNVYSTTLAQVNVPVHLVATSDGSNIKIYVNGVLEGTLAAGDAYTGYTTPEFIIGYGHNGPSYTDYSDGAVILARIWAQALTPHQVGILSSNPYGMFESIKRSIWYVPPVGAVAPTSIFYGPLTGPLSGPI